MKRFFSFAILFLLYIGITFPVTAQQIYSENVELLEIDETTATFRSEGIADNKKEILDMAEKTIFHKLFYSGVDGFNEGEKLIENKNPYWEDNFFKSHYLLFIKGANLENEENVEKLNLQKKAFRGYAIVVINYEALIRDLKIHKLTKDSSEDIDEAPPVEEKPKKKFGKK